MATIRAHGIAAQLPSGFEGRIGAVALMGPDDVFATLFEYGPESLGTALFSPQGWPNSFGPGDFSPARLRRGIPGQSGAQRFFTEEGRPFSFYAVLGSHVRRGVLVPRVNALVSSLEISPTSTTTQVTSPRWN